jgi:hypothetical protein
MYVIIYENKQKEWHPATKPLDKTYWRKGQGKGIGWSPHRR